MESANGHQDSVSGSPPRMRYEIERNTFKAKPNVSPLVGGGAGGEGSASAAFAEEARASHTEADEQSDTAGFRSCRCRHGTVEDDVVELDIGILVDETAGNEIRPTTAELNRLEVIIETMREALSHGAAALHVASEIEGGTTGFEGLPE